MALSATQSQVAGAIKDLNDFPESVKQMLLTALPNCFGSDLHQYQRETASMLRKSLEQARANAGERQVAATQRVKEAQTVLETLQADVENTTGVEETARANLNEEIAALETAQNAVKSEETLCETAEAAKASVAVERQTIEAAKAEVESIQNGTFRMLLDGGWEDEEIRDACIDGVCSYLSAEDADAVLLAALPKALACRPAECGAFDKIAIEEAVQFFSNKVLACNAELAKGEESFEDATAEHAGAWAILDMAREKVQASSEMRDSADAALQSAIVDKKLAQSKAMDQDQILATMLSESTVAEDRVQRLDVALSALAQLEAGEEADKENKETAMEVDKENKENAMAVDEERIEKAMAIDHLPVAITA